MNPYRHQTATPVLLLVLLLSWINYLAVQTVVVHTVEPANSAALATSMTLTNSMTLTGGMALTRGQVPSGTVAGSTDVDHGHTHGEQPLHQLVSIAHQHSQHTPDHLHDAPQLPVVMAVMTLRLPEHRPVIFQIGCPSEYTFRIERPPRLYS
ncbi:MAG: hypothetical protein OIF57_07700 [Marinobacterium sp.]|nr:hypothetical protein [Marinobacterium sp.]